ncbi:MAG: hypothetical protein GX786_10660 [Clostridiales bacterium]|nr:hypothetical protein [Clostridiales bacterium]
MKTDYTYFTFAFASIEEKRYTDRRDFSVLSFTENTFNNILVSLKETGISFVEYEEKKALQEKTIWDNEKTVVNIEENPIIVLTEKKVEMVEPPAVEDVRDLLLQQHIEELTPQAEKADHQRLVQVEEEEERGPQPRVVKGSTPSLVFSLKTHNETKKAEEAKKQKPLEEERDKEKKIERNRLFAHLSEKKNKEQAKQKDKNEPPFQPEATAFSSVFKRTNGEKKRMTGSVSDVKRKLPKEKRPF